MYEELYDDDSALSGRFLTKECILKILDLRFEINGLKRLNELFE